jgi:hypothetical protein
MAIPCIYTYKGKDYSYSEFRAKIAREGIASFGIDISGGGAKTPGAGAPKPSGAAKPQTPKVVGVTNAATKVMLENLGMDPVAKSMRKSNPELWDSVVEEIQSGVDPRDEVSKLVYSSDPLINKRVQAMVLADRINVLNEHDKIQKELEQAIDSNDLPKQNSLRLREEQNRIDIMNNAIADEKIGGQWGAFGSFRQQLATREFDLISIERRAKNASGKVELTEAEHNKFVELAGKHAELQEQYKALVEKNKADRAEFEAKQAESREQSAQETIDKYKQQIEEKSEPKERKPSLSAEKKKRKDELKNKLFNRFNDVTSAAALILDKEFYEYSSLLFEEAAGDFAYFAKDIASSFKKIAKEDIPEVWKKLGGSKEATDVFKNLAEEAKDISEGELHEGMKSTIDKMVYELVEKNMDIKIDEVVDKIAEELGDEIQNLDKQELKDMISGYGKFSELTKDEVKLQVSEIKSQGRLDSALEATERGELPLRNGIERQKKSQETREKQAKIAKNIKEKNLVSPLTAEETSARYKTDLEAHHRRLENAIEDVQKEIDENKRREKAQGKTFTDDITKELEEKLKDLKKLRDEQVGKPGMTEEQKAESAAKNLEKAIEKIKDDIEAVKAGKDVGKPVTVKRRGGLSLFGFGKEKKATLSSNKIDYLKNIKAMYETELSELIPDSVKDKALIDKYVKGRERRLKFLEEKLANKDFAPKPKAKPFTTTDPAAEKVLEDIRRVEKEIAHEVEELRLANRNKINKAIDFASKLQRFSLFASQTGMFKLLFAAMARPVLKVPNEVSQFILSQTPVAKEIMKKSITHYTPVPFSSPFIKYYSTLFAKETAKESWRELSSQSNWNIKYSGHEGIESNDFLSKPQRMHGALKTFPKIAQFESSVQKGLETLATTIDPNTGQYYDITKPDVQWLAVEGAKQDALSDVFMSDAEVSRVIKNAFESLSRSEKMGVQALGLIATQQLPIIKVPVNFYVEVLEKTPIVGMIRAWGIVKRSGEKGATEDLRGGIKNLTPEQARKTARVMENQIVGAMGVAVGLALFNQYGDEAEKMLEEQKLYLHNAFTDLVKMGVKYGEVMAHGEVDKKTKEVETYGKVSGLFKAEWEEIKKVTKDFPAIKAATDIAKTFLSDDSIKMKVAEVLSTLVVPGGVSGYARSRDKNVSGEPIRRIAKDWQDVFKLKIPGFRETVKSQFDLIQEKRMQESAVEQLETKIQKEKKKPFYSRDAVKKMRKEQDKIAAEIKEKNLDKFIENEEAYYELCKEFGVEPIGKKNLSEERKEVEGEIFKGKADRLKLPKKD